MHKSFDSSLTQPLDHSTSGEYGSAVDMWSMGCVFAELWMREPIFHGTDRSLRTTRRSCVWLGVCCVVVVVEVVVVL